MRNYDLGNRIYELRKDKGLSQKELGEMVGVTNKSVSKWENGTTIPKTDTLVKLANIFEISPQELLQGKTENKLTLSQLSSQANEMFLQEELDKRDKEILKAKLVRDKRYLIIISSLFVSIFIIICLFNILGISIIEDGLKWYEVLFDSLIMSYVLSSIFSGVVFAVSIAKKLPIWALILCCILFPLTVLAIEFIGLVATPIYIINSTKNIIKEKRNEQK